MRRQARGQQLAARQAWRQRLCDALAHEPLSADKIRPNFPSTAVLDLVRAYYNPAIDFTMPVPHFQGSRKQNVAGIIDTVHQRF